MFKVYNTDVLVSGGTHSGGYHVVIILHVIEHLLCTNLYGQHKDESNVIPVQIVLETVTSIVIKKNTDITTGICLVTTNVPLI